MVVLLLHSLSNHTLGAGLRQLGLNDAGCQTEDT